MSLLEVESIVYVYGIFKYTLSQRFQSEAVSTKIKQAVDARDDAVAVERKSAVQNIFVFMLLTRPYIAFVCEHQISMCFCVRRRFIIYYSLLLSPAFCFVSQR